MYCALPLFLRAYAVWLAAAMAAAAVACLRLSATASAVRAVEGRQGGRLRRDPPLQSDGRK